MKVEVGRDDFGNGVEIVEKVVIVLFYKHFTIFTFLYGF